TGHLLGAAGAIEAIASVMALINGIIPPTINHFTDDPVFDTKLNLTFNKAVDQYSEDDNTKYSAGRFTSQIDGSTLVSIDQLDKDLVVNLKNMKVGEITPPLTYTDDRGKTGVRIVYLARQTEPHRENLKDDYDRVAQQALAEKKQTVLDAWFKQHIPDFYISIDPKYRTCKSLSYWYTSESTAAN
ncbi:MAG: hypothetical protein ABJB05_00755, partial [Parafilimonas sp.]